MSPIEIQVHVEELRVERALASTAGLTMDAAYMSDLEQEIVVTTHAYVEAAVTEIATLRSELFGRQFD